MDRRRVGPNKIFWTAGVIVLCLALSGCSGARNLAGFFTFWHSDRPSAGLTNNDVERIGFQVRPPKGNAEAHYNLGCYYQERDRHREAVEEFQKAAAIDPTHVKALNRMGVSYDELRDFPRAVACYQAAVAVNPSADYIYNNLAHSYRLQGRFEESISTFKKALALNNGSSRIHNNLGLVYTLTGQHDQARTEFEQAIALAKPEAATPLPSAVVVDAEKAGKSPDAKEAGEMPKAAQARSVLKAVEVTRIASKNALEAKPAAKATPVSLFRTAKTTASVAARTSGDGRFNPERFYAEAARSIVQIRPVSMTPVKGWTPQSGIPGTWL